MSHENVTSNEKDNAASVKAKIGLWMFLIYTIFYAGFIIIAAVVPEVMGTSIGKINLAIFYGLSLIVFAVVLAFIYNFLCARYEKKLNTGEEANEEDEQ